jgi:hypothetical protein
MATPLPFNYSLDTALKAAAPGDMIEVEPGTWPGQTITYDASMEGATRPIRVDASGAVFTGTMEMLGVQHIEWDGGTFQNLWNLRPSTGNSLSAASKVPHNLLFTNITAKTFLLRNLKDSVLRDCTFGGWDASITDLGPPKVGAYAPADGSPPHLLSGVLIENCLFRDFLRTLAGTAHAEGLYFDAGVDGLTVRGCHWTNCAVMDVFSNGEKTGLPITNVLFESCMFDVARNGTGGPTGGTIVLKGGASNWTFRGNSILGQGGTIRVETGNFPGFRFERNAIQNGSFSWAPESVWEGNVMKFPGTTGSEQANDVGFVSSSIANCDLNACFRNDLHVKPDSPAGKAGAGVPVGDTEPPPPPPPDPDTLPLTELSPPGAEPVILGWTPVPGAVGYRFTTNGLTVSHTWDPTRSQVKFSRAGEHAVHALMPGPWGDWPN